MNKIKENKEKCYFCGKVFDNLKDHLKACEKAGNYI